MLPGDDEHALHDRIKPVERRLLIEWSGASPPATSTSAVARPHLTSRPPGDSMAGPSHDPALYRERDVVPIRRALVSVSDKTELIDSPRRSPDAGVEIVSTGSTAPTIRDAGYAVTDVAARHRVPRVAGRAGEDAAPGRPRGTARRPPPRGRTSSSWRSSASSRSSSSW